MWLGPRDLYLPDLCLFHLGSGSLPYFHLPVFRPGGGLYEGWWWWQVVDARDGFIGGVVNRWWGGPLYLLVLF